MLCHERTVTMRNLWLGLLADVAELFALLAFLALIFTVAVAVGG